ncbi:MAG: DUF4422 domain-containing protein [Candidatus Gastranaerophilales bacterium]|nr:DUF4422 domain-containing protein [Candidatus Gastranaerophilales bacterium]
MCNIKILIVSHKPFKCPEGRYYQPVHAGRDIAQTLSKDGKINNRDYQWLLENTIGDNEGENISVKNRYYSECTALYQAWKNYERLGNPDYIGLMHYRRHFIFNEEYYRTKSKNKWENALGFVSEMFINDEYQTKIGLNDGNIRQACRNYDLIVSKDAHLDLIHGRNIREDYAKTIPGVKVKDFDLMIDIVLSDYPEYREVVEKNINGYKKSLYQMFIMKKELFFEYCEFLFGVLLKIESLTDFSGYSTNGKRTLGYLAEDLLSMFVWKKSAEGLKVLKLAAAMLEFPYEDSEITVTLKKGCPSYLEYLITKSKSLFLKGDAKQTNKEKYQAIRKQRRLYKKLKLTLEEVGNA